MERIGRNDATVALIQGRKISEGTETEKEGRLMDFALDSQVERSSMYVMCVGNFCTSCILTLLEK